MKEKLIVFLLLPISGIIFFILGTKYKNGCKRNLLILYTILLTVVDEFIKVFLAYIVNIKGFNFAGNLIYPMRNEFASSYGSFLNKNISMKILICINIFMFIFSIVIYNVHIKKYGKSFWSDWFIIFTSSGLFSSLIDKIFWGGSLDYINLANNVLLDLKDIYMLFGIVLIICEVILNEKVSLFKIRR